MRQDIGLEAWEQLCREVIGCRACPRLVRWREAVARQPRRAFAQETYWAKPLPGFGDLDAQILVCGLAPAAHGGNRTGRMFTGDRSGDFLYRCLYQAGLANQPVSRNQDDGLQLRGCYITAIVRCAPPGNRPSPQERDRCLRYLVRELALLKQVQLIVALGQFAWHGVLRALQQLNYHIRPRPPFRHGAEVALGPYILLGSYHPSQQNTFTGKLTETMLIRILRRAQELVKPQPARSP
ncbi:MAG: uracil-DNA glycosylase [Gemmatales bacterium]|nr:uracil-DNA glycosylase [Gemmatales bacterium]MDW8175211.1 uracil-DNA glycosylase [Gemmatales bacterium]